MIFDPVFFSLLTWFLIGWGTTFLVVFWLSLMIWVIRDIRRRTRNTFARFISFLMVTLFFLPGLLIYLILRPVHTLEEEYSQSLQEESLLQSIENVSLCPGCSRRVQDDWIACPGCHNPLKKSCQKCGKALELPWKICPFCGSLATEPTGS